MIAIFYQANILIQLTYYTRHFNTSFYFLQKFTFFGSIDQ